MSDPVTFNNAFFDELSRSDGVRRVVDEARDRIADTARADAPEDSGDYRNGIGTASKYQDRYVGLVVASDSKSMLIESKQGILARALRKNSKGRRRA